MGNGATSTVLVSGSTCSFKCDLIGNVISDEPATIIDVNKNILDFVDIGYSPLCLLVYSC